MKKVVLISLSACLLLITPACIKSREVPSSVRVERIAGTDLVLLNMCWEALRGTASQPFNFKVCYQYEPLLTYNEAEITVSTLPNTPPLRRLEILDLTRDTDYSLSLGEPPTNQESSLQETTSVRISRIKLSQIFSLAESDPPNNGLKPSISLTSTDGRVSTIDGIVIKFAPSR